MAWSLRLDEIPTIATAMDEVYVNLVNASKKMFLLFVCLYVCVCLSSFILLTIKIVTLYS